MPNTLKEAIETSIFGEMVALSEDSEQLIQFMTELNPEQQVDPVYTAFFDQIKFKIAQFQGAHSSYNRLFLEHLQQQPELMQRTFQAGIKADGMNLRYIKPELQTYALCRSAVEKNGYALQYCAYRFIDLALCEKALADKVGAIRAVNISIRGILDDPERMDNLNQLLAQMDGRIQLNNDAFNTCYHLMEELTKELIKSKLQCISPLLNDALRSFIEHMDRLNVSNADLVFQYQLLCEAGNSSNNVGQKSHKMSL